MEVFAACLGLGGPPSSVLTGSGETQNFAGELTDLCTTTQDKTGTVIGFIDEIKTTFTEISTGNMNPKKFKAMLDLLRGDKMKEVVGVAGEMDDLAISCVDKAAQLQKAAEDGTADVPENIRAESTPRDAGIDEEAEQGELDGLEKDIEEVGEFCADLENLNIISAPTTGKRAFEGLVTKGGSLRTLFDRIKEFCSKVVSAAQAVVSETCCAAIQATIAAFRAMMQCLKLSNIITMLVNAGKRLIAAIRQLVDLIPDKCQNLIDQFSPAKKLTNWLSGLGSENPLGQAYQGTKQFLDDINPENRENQDTGKLCGMGI